MALYLVIHSEREEGEDAARPPTRLLDLARASIVDGTPRWLKAWSPDLHDDRIFSLWEARDGNEILAALERFGFLDDRTATAHRVREWGPEDVLASAGTESAGDG